MHKKDNSIDVNNVMANITLHHTYSHHIHTKYEIIHIHPNMTFLIIPIAYTIYTYISYIHKSKLDKKTKIKKNISQKGKILPFHPKIFQNVKGRNNIILELQILIETLQNDCNCIIIIIHIFKLS